jgi:sugar (pentulose or hexulose) kinase
MTADACGIKVIAGPEEATAAGNVLVQAMGNGDVRDLNHIRQVVRNSFAPTKYIHTAGSDWQTAYLRFESVLRK